MWVKSSPPCWPKVPTSPRTHSIWSRWSTRPCPPSFRAEDAIAPGAPVVHETIGGNVLFHNEFETPGVDAVFAAAEHVLGETFYSSRVAAVAIEPRGCLAEYDRGTGALTFWSSTQIPHMLRHALAEHLDWPDTKGPCHRSRRWRWLRHEGAHLSRGVARRPRWRASSAARSSGCKIVPTICSPAPRHATTCSPSR